MTAEFRTETYQTMSLPMISPRRVLSAFTLLWLSALTVCSTSAQEPSELVANGRLKSTLGTELFEAPVRLTVNDLPINANKEVANISPTLYDVDGDGKPELITGGVSGELGIHRSENVSQDGDSTFKGDPAWGPRQVFEDTSGEALTFTNW